jgi:hypothetical protein
MCAGEATLMIHISKHNEGTGWEESYTFDQIPIGAVITWRGTTDRVPGAKVKRKGRVIRKTVEWRNYPKGQPTKTIDVEITAEYTSYVKLSQFKNVETVEMANKFMHVERTI